VSYHTIVVGTDGSVTATVALRTAARLAKRTRAELTVVTAIDPPTIEEEQAVAVLEHAREVLSRDRVKAATETARGAPADIVLRYAYAANADLVVVGNKGMGQPRRLRLGAVPDQIAHAGGADILIVDTRAAVEGQADPRAYQRFLIGTDGSPTANECARKGMELALMMGAAVTLLYIGDPLVGAIKLEETGGSAPEGVEVTPWLEAAGDPAEVIVGVARELPADLIVVGNKGMSGARRLLGSVPNSVAHYAPCDVLIAKTVDRTLADIVPDSGAVLDVDGRNLAVYRDAEGTVHAVSPRCTHMGCTVDWNDAEKTWDCPCHGSRYDRFGEILRGPAAKPLAPQDVKE
jgi:nucleotide-binding universal stress UspA family protein/nitrite reductase/ring-hydroxylating ferredoxin subunit